MNMTFSILGKKLLKNWTIRALQFWGLLFDCVAPKSRFATIRSFCFCIFFVAFPLELSRVVSTIFAKNATAKLFVLEQRSSAGV